MIEKAEVIQLKTMDQFRTETKEGMEKIMKEVFSEILNAHISEDEIEVDFRDNPRNKKCSIIVNDEDLSKTLNGSYEKEKILSLIKKLLNLKDKGDGKCFEKYSEFYRVTETGHKHDEFDYKTFHVGEVRLDFLDFFEKIGNYDFEDKRSISVLSKIVFVFFNPNLFSLKEEEEEVIKNDHLLEILDYHSECIREGVNRWAKEKRNGKKVVNISRTLSDENNPLVFLENLKDSLYDIGSNLKEIEKIIAFFRKKRILGTDKILDKLIKKVIEENKDYEKDIYSLFAN